MKTNRRPKNAKSIRRMISIGLLLIMAIVFTLTTDAFLGFRNIANLLKDSAYLGIIALGMAFVMIGGGIDLSAGGIVCVVGILCVRLSMTGVPGIIVVLGGIVLGAFCGVINAFFITKIRLTEFVATLATGFIFTGLTLVFSFRQGHSITTVPVVNKSYLAFRGNIGGIYYITIIWIILAIILYLLLTKTSFGLHTYAIGSHSRSALMSGIDTSKVKALGYLISGGAAGLAAVLQVTLIGASPPNIGTGYEFRAIAACVVGGVVLGGGKGDTLSALLGSLFLVMLLNGLFKFGLSTSWEYILQGVIILIATAFDAVFNRITAKRLLAQSH
ncbi:MAG: ABC transporter permease [Oscillospiraceae bacterium]|nr:ABC transporter permease [Oscillospiraceae bacterium]